MWNLHNLKHLEIFVVYHGYLLAIKYEYLLYCWRFAASYRDGSHYFVLLILTDGVITDMPATIQAIVSVLWLFVY